MKLTAKPTLRHEPPDPDEDPIINFCLTPEECEEVIDTHGKEREEWLNGLHEKHIEPTERQAAFIEEAFNAIKEKLASYGFDIPAIRRDRPAILFLSRKDYWKEKYGKEENDHNPDTLGFYDPNTNTVILWYKQTAWGKDQRNQEFLHTLTHELLHAYSLRILQAYRRTPFISVMEGREPEIAEETPALSTHRSGMYLYKLGMPEKERFRGLDEALTENLAVELTNEVVTQHRLDTFEDVVRQQLIYVLSRMSTVRTRALHERAKELGLPHFSWVTEDIRKRMNDVITALLQEGVVYEYPSPYQTYKKERKVLDRLIMVLARKCPEYNGKEEELRRLFYEAKFSGSMLKIGRLIERTLGKGTFRLIAEDFLGAELHKRLRLYNTKGW